MLFKKVGQQLTSTDCSKLYTCNQAGAVALVTSLTACGKNALCSIDKNNNPTCLCQAGFYGNPQVGCTNGKILKDYQ